MDNLSHAVVGLAAGELVHRNLPPEPSPHSQALRRRLLLVSCALAGNLPDLDYFLTSLIPAPLGYLLHHRGHTHTLLYILPQAVLLWALIRLCWPSARALLKQSAPARSGFVAALCLGFALHLLMDYLNSYGIHPLHPFDSRWLYGDMVFILEPVFWIAFGVPLAMMVRRRALQVLLIATLLGVPLYFTTQAYLTWPSFAALALLAAGAAMLQHRAGQRGQHALVMALVAGSVFIGMQGMASEKARRTVAAALQQSDPDSRMVDAALTAFPANPLCWNFVSVESNEGAGSYRLRRGVLSLAPDLLPAGACPPSLAWRAGGHDDMSPALAFADEEQGSLAVLRRLKNENCHFDAWLRFARAPAVSATGASDLRFGAVPGGNFTTLRFADFAQRECARHVPGWDYPRADLLVPAR